MSALSSARRDGQSEGPPGHSPGAVVTEHIGVLSSSAPALPRAGCVEAALGSDGHSMGIQPRDG